MRNLVMLLAVVVGAPAFGATSPDLAPFHQLFQNGELHAGFGLARDLIAHVYQGRRFAPRDYDFAVIGTNWSEEEAELILSQYGKVIKKIQMSREVIKPSGRVFSYHYGFVIIIDYLGTQVDFKFFNSLEDAHTRGLYNVEKILFPMAGRSIEELISDTEKIRRDGRTPNSLEVSDPHDGITAILQKSPITVNWAKAKASPLDWLIRGAMIYAKMGVPKLAPQEIEQMKEAVRSVQFMLKSDYALIDRAIAHKRWWHVRELLESVNFFDHIQTWRWSEPVRARVQEWRLQPRESLFCRAVFI